jgi:hypothetical protein
VDIGGVLGVSLAWFDDGGGVDQRARDVFVLIV